MKKKKEISTIHIQKTTRSPDSVCLEDRLVIVKNHDIDKCKKIAKEIWKEDLK